MHRHLLSSVLIAVLAGAAAAHDFWIRPSSFRPGPADRIEVDLRVGEGFRGEAVARNPEKIERFVAVRGSGAEEPIAGVEGKAPAGFLRARSPRDPEASGLLWIAYRSRPSFVELPAAKFESYLAEEGLERIVAERKERGESAEPGREAYARCAKSLLRTGPGEGASATAVVGFPLELVLDRDPSAAPRGEPLEVRLLFRGRPAEGVLVGCASEREPERELRARTDSEGRVRFEGVGEGVWLLRAVHMVRAEENADADWESFWASLTFEIAR